MRSVFITTDIPTFFLPFPHKNVELKPQMYIYKKKNILSHVKRLFSFLPSHKPHVYSLSVKHKHFALPLLTQWYDNICAQRRTLPLAHTQLCNGEQFYGSTQKIADAAFWLSPPAPPLPAAAIRSLVTLSLLSARCHASCTHLLHFQHPGFSSFSSALPLPSPASRCLLTFSNMSFPSFLFCRFAVLLTSLLLLHKSVFCKYFTSVKYFYRPRFCISSLFFFHILKSRWNSNIFFSPDASIFFLIISSLVV